MSTARTLTMPDGRTVGYADFGPADGTPVVWCHGGPGSRLEPAQVSAEAAAAGFRLIGVDRPGYGLSTPRPGRSIADWVPDGLAVLDALDVEECVAIGVSTGGAYALAVAAAAPDRVTGVIACCALTDMRWPEGRRLVESPLTSGLWDTPTRDAAIAVAVDVAGEDGSKMFDSSQSDGPQLPPADMALFVDPAWLVAFGDAMAEMFAHGMVGYVDDRLADGVGWGSFDVGAVRAPTIVLHGREDSIVDVAQAAHTASLVPGARLKIVDELAHLSIVLKVPETLAELCAR
jgi:pimeloyl-ACP methyl ester carboxylesterase